MECQTMQICVKTLKRTKCKTVKLKNIVFFSLGQIQRL